MDNGHVTMQIQKETKGHFVIRTTIQYLIQAKD